MCSKRALRNASHSTRRVTLTIGSLSHHWPAVSPSVPTEAWFSRGDTRSLPGMTWRGFRFSKAKPLDFIRSKAFLQKFVRFSKKGSSSVSASRARNSQ